MSQDVELWIKELTAAGWKKYASSVWKSPSGRMFRGPYKAWELMHSRPELNDKHRSWMDVPAHHPLARKEGNVSKSEREYWPCETLLTVYFPEPVLLPEMIYYTTWLRRNFPTLSKYLDH